MNNNKYFVPKQKLLTIQCYIAVFGFLVGFGLAHFV